MIEVSVLGLDSQIRVSGDTAHEVLAQLVDIEKSEVLLTVGRLNRKSEAQESLGKHLGAELIDEKPKEPAAAEPQGFGAEPVPPWAKVVPNAPLINGKPAWLVNGKSRDGRPWVAFVHPDANVNPELPETDDPEDPRLASGQARFRKFVR